MTSYNHYYAFMLSVNIVIDQGYGEDRMPTSE